MAKHKNKENDIDQQLLDDVKTVASTPSGRRLLFYILSLGNIYSSTFTGNSETFFLEGKRAVCLALLELINDADPTIYIKLLQNNGGTDD